MGFQKKSTTFEEFIGALLFEITVTYHTLEYSYISVNYNTEIAICTGTNVTNFQKNIY